MKYELSICGQLVRTHDPDRFLLSMFAPAARREALWALFAFNYEIARTRETVSETRLGLIRLQWWREAVAAIFEGGAVSGHEVVRALAEAIRGYDLPREDFDMLMQAREFDLEDVLPGNLEGLVNYADFTSTPLTRLALRVLGANEDHEPVQIVSVNYALAGLLRSVPFYARQRRCVLPEDLLVAHGQVVDALYEMKPVYGLPTVVEAVAGQIVPGVVCEERFLKGMQGVALIYSSQIRSCGYDVFHPRMALEPSFKVFRLLFHLCN